MAFLFKPSATMANEDDEVESEAPSFEDRVEQLCDRFHMTREISSLRSFLEARAQQRSAELDGSANLLRATRLDGVDEKEGLGVGKYADDEGDAQTPGALSASGLECEDKSINKLAIYRAWAHIFREALAVKHHDLLDELMSWIDSFTRDHPAVSPLGGVEAIRIYASLRTGLQSKVLSKEAQMTAFDVLARLPLLPLLPLMQISLSALDAEEFITSAMNRVRPGKKLQLGTADMVSTIRSFTYDENPVPLGSHEKKILILKLKDRKTRSASFMAVMAYLQALERESSQIVSVEIRFRAMARIISRQTSSFPPSLPTAYTLFREAVTLNLSAAEIAYPATFQAEIGSLVEDLRAALDRALEASKATNMQMLSLHQNSRAQRGSRTSSGMRKLSGQPSFSGMDSQSMTRMLSNMGSSQMLRNPSVSSRQLTARTSLGASKMGLFSRDPSAFLSSASALSSLGPIGEVQIALGSPTSPTSGKVPTPTELAEAEGKKEAQRKNRPTTAEFDNEKFYAAPQGTKVAEVPKIWLQVDTNPESVALTQPDLVGDDEMTSQHFGTFRLYKNRLTWVMVNPPDTGSMRASQMSDLESVVTSSTDRYDEEGGDVPSKVYDVHRTSADPAEGMVKKFGKGILTGDEHFDPDASTARVRHVSTPIARSFHRLLASVLYTESGSQRALLQQENDEEEVQTANRGNEIAASLFTVPTSAIRRYTFGPLDQTRSFLALYTSNEVIKMFPFGRREITQLANALNEFTGLKASTVGSQTDYSIKRKMDDMRRRLQDSINGKWIHHTEELHRVLINLTKDNTPIRMRDLERIYHSARHNKTIVRECIPILQEIWRCSKGQDSMLKVLAVVDRILDGDVLHGDDPVLGQMLQWLHQIETGLDPYSHSRPLKLLLKVCHRAEYLQTQTILPLIETFYDDEVFVMPMVYDMYLRAHEK